MNLKPLFLTVFVSVLCSILFFSCAFSDEETCIILIVDESQNDRYIQEKLSSVGLGDFISESSLVVPIDDFGSLKFISLESFHEEIAPFDPRDNGYAGKLRSFFVQNGNRFFYKLSEPNTSQNTLKIKKELSSALEHIPFTLIILGQKESGLIYFLLLFVACSFTLFLTPSRRLFVFQIPLLLAIGYYGFYSLILAAILIGIWELLKAPLGELSASILYKRRNFDYAGKGLRGIIERLKPFRQNLILLLVFLLFLPLFSFFGLIPFPIMAALCFSFIFLYLLSLKIESLYVQKNRHVPFTPVLMFPVKTKTFSFFPLLLPFALTSLLAIFLPQTLFNLKPGQDQIPIETRHFISLEEYNNYITYQHSFSFMPMNQESAAYHSINQEANQEALIQIEYFRYYLGEDGLIAGRETYNELRELEQLRIDSEPSNVLQVSGAPPFPLEKLMDFLIKYNDPLEGKSVDLKDLFEAPPVIRHKEWLSVIIILFLCIMDFLRSAIVPKKRIPVFRDKRMAA